MKKRDYRKTFDGSTRLFEHCWRKYLQLVRCGNAIGDIEECLDSIASEAVNNVRSSFYIYGR